MKPSPSGSYLLDAAVMAEVAVAELCHDQHPDNECWHVLRTLRAAIAVEKGVGGYETAYRNLLISSKTAIDAWNAERAELLATLAKALASLKVIAPHNRYPDGTVVPGDSELIREIKTTIAKSEGGAS